MSWPGGRRSWRSSRAHLEAVRQMAEHPFLHGFVCPRCGMHHKGVPLDVEHLKPASYFSVPQAEIPERVFLTDDLCVIDDSRFFIRGVLPLPIVGRQEEFQWGLWAEVGEDDFKHYLEVWEKDATLEPPFSGLLDGPPKPYLDSDRAPLDVRLRTADLRPVFKLRPGSGSLAQDQQNGIRPERVLELLHETLPHLFE